MEFLRRTKAVAYLTTPTSRHEKKTLEVFVRWLHLFEGLVLDSL